VTSPKRAPWPDRSTKRQWRLTRPERVWRQAAAVSRDVADDRGYLGERDNEAVRRRGHGGCLARGAGREQTEGDPICCLAVERRSKTQGAGVTVFGAAAELIQDKRFPLIVD
jgi:hypothetical protein